MSELCAARVPRRSRAGSRSCRADRVTRAWHFESSTERSRSVRSDICRRVEIAGAIPAVATAERERSIADLEVEVRRVRAVGGADGADALATLHAGTGGGLDAIEVRV